MSNNSPKRARRIALMISGITDAVIGGILLLIGFGFLPIDPANYGVESLYVNLLGGIMFLLGVGTFAYNLSRLEE